MATKSRFALPIGWRPNLPWLSHRALYSYAKETMVSLPRVPQRLVGAAVTRVRRLVSNVGETIMGLFRSVFACLYLLLVTFRLVRPKSSRPRRASDLLTEAALAEPATSRRLVLSESEMQRLFDVLRLADSEKDRRVSGEEDSSSEANSAFLNFQAVCDGCRLTQRCVELPRSAHGSRLLLCATCLKSFLSGAWSSDAIVSEENFCVELVQLAAASTTNEPCLQRKRLDSSQGSVNLSSDESEEEADGEENFSSNKFPAGGNSGETDVYGEERPVDVPAGFFPTSASTPQRPSNLVSNGQPDLSLTSSTFSEGEGAMSPAQASEYSRILSPGQLAGEEPIGELELGIRVGAETSSRQTGLLIDVLQGYNFNHWATINGKPSFQIYAKCYLMSGSKVKAKLKTHSVPPSAQPQFFDQLISVMDKKLLEKLDKVKVQVWSHQRSLTKNFAIATATINLSDVRLDDDTSERYPVFYVGQPVTPPTPQTMTDSPQSSFSRSSSGRFDLRSSFRRRRKSGGEVSDTNTHPAQ